MSEECKVKACKIDSSKECIQEDTINEIIKELESMNSNMKGVEGSMNEISSEMRTLFKVVDSMSHSVNKVSDSISKVFEMSYLDKIETLKQFSAQEIKINDNTHKIEDSELQSEIDNVNQNLNLANKQLNKVEGKIGWWKSMRDKGLLTAIGLIVTAAMTWVAAKFIAMQGIIETLNDIPK